jgi:tetratricopeptide (TPR) repeat protein
MKLTQLIFSVLFLQVMNSQSKEGYWDNVRATNEVIILKAGERKQVKTLDFPEGTTEVVYRISLLDDNQKMSSSLVSLLKSIPDPTGISQGTAGAVYLLSTITGDDKCKYAIFSGEKEARHYETTADSKSACYIQNTPINKEAKLLTTSSKCIQPSLKNLWFGFESDNMVFKQKIILEVVAWVNINQSRGWNTDTKKEILALSNTTDVVQLISKKEQFRAYFLEAIEQKMRYSDFKKLLPEEKSRLITETTQIALQKSGEAKQLSSSIRKKAQELFDNNKKQEAITMIQDEILSKNRATADDYSLQARMLMTTKQFDKALSLLTSVASTFETDLYFQLTLAHAYLLKDEFKKAKTIHKKFQNQNIYANISWQKQTENDFNGFEKSNISNKGFKKILNLWE